MIAKLTGTIAHIDLRYIILDTAGVGYKVFLTNDALEYVSHDKDNTVSLWIYTVVREDSLDLYGFKTRDEQEFFELLISISGIGPKTALGILSTASVDTLKEAIYSGDPSYLTKVSGVGRKSAE
jgi:holliday junction DNA helicase RuvA